MEFLDDKALLRELLAERHVGKPCKTYLNSPTDQHERMLRLEQLGVATRVDHQDSPSSINWKVHYERAQELYEIAVESDEQHQHSAEEQKPENAPYELYKKYMNLEPIHAESIMRQQELYNAMSPVAGTAREILWKLHKAVASLEAIEKSIDALRNEVSQWGLK